MLRAGINESEGTLGYTSLSAMDAEPTAEILARMFASLVRSRGKLPVMDSATMAAINAAASWMASPHGRGLIVSGKIGCGKTLLARAVKRLFDRAHDSALRSKRSTLAMVSAEELCRLSEDDPEIYKDVATAPYLIIDDLGSEPVETMRYGARKTPLRAALERRYDKRLLTLITTNLSTDMLRDRYGSRMADRWREQYQWLTFGGLSKRGSAASDPDPDPDPYRERGPTSTIDEFLALSASEGRCIPPPPGGVAAMTADEFKTLVLSYK